MALPPHKTVARVCWFYPWLIALMRYDDVNSSTDFLNGASHYSARRRFSPGLQVLVRANIKTVFEYQRRWEQPAGTDNVFFWPNGFMLGIDYSF